ncbi:MAG TPA: hypothetical protein VKB86_16770 [Pyrinomonadaceae bacterium]|nr:hypothetical protein [Pyrinomonadaceae bacterium]
MTGEVQASKQRNPLVARLICYWNRFPVVVRAMLGGFILSAAGTVPWAILVSANFRYWSDVPWAVAPATLYLLIFWRFVSGVGWPKSTTETRRTLCRANPLPAEVWGMALIAGAVGLTAVVLLQDVMARLVLRALR